ncbi:MAG TPA: cytochrome c [Hyphomicrobium sp.]|nr:cytochrome c [Hyphomicrobium sp.]
MSKSLRLAMAAVATLLFGVGPSLGDDRARSLESLVRQDCGSCHGMTLKGGLGPDLLASRLSNVPSETLAAIILNGVPGTPMPAWRGLLSEEDALWIADYLKTEAK